MQNLIELTSVTRFYGTVIGANDLSLSLPEGAYGLVGPNGAGKTTLIELLTGGLRPSMGTVRVYGKNPVIHAQVLKRIGVCPARDILLPTVSAWHWVRQLLQVSGYAKSAAGDRAAEVLERVGLKDAMTRPMGSYSLGMRQRAKLAQSIAHDPDLLILDEPFNGLDPIARHDFTQLLREWAVNGKSLILASHVLHEVEAVTDAFLLIFGARLLAYGSAGELRGLLADLPREVVIESRDVTLLASRLAGEPWLESLTIAHARDELRLAVSEPNRLYRFLLQCSAEHGIAIQRISSSDGDMATLFRQLTSRHQGHVA